MNEPLAHSAKPERGVPVQTYRDHILAVRRRAVENARRCTAFRGAAWPEFEICAEWAASYHDLGKLLPENQAVLRATGRREALPAPHADAGTAYLMSQRQRESGIAVWSHHAGLPNIEGERARQYRPPEAPFRDERVRAAVDRVMAELLEQHQAIAGGNPAAAELAWQPRSGLSRRLLLSCLVDADHSDTAAHEGSECEGIAPGGRWAERLAKLDEYVERLSERGGDRDEYRAGVYQASRRASHEDRFVACDSPVGSGKTTAVMAHLLRAAAERGLRHVFVVLPYTNIIRQAVEVYQSAVVLEGEDPEQVVAAHHHQAEFSDPELRHMTTLWRAPIIVTTAVQFFETLGGNRPAVLRKLHELPGSVVMIDEAHAAMPVHLWPFMWGQLEELAQEWGCRFVLASGSLARFWTLPQVNPQTPRIPYLTPAELRKGGMEAERKRVEYRRCEAPLTAAELVRRAREAQGPRLVVLNTVQSAAVVARAARQEGCEVEHLSTALCPRDRAGILRRVTERLREDPNGDWMLVATSCVEAGVDLDFATAFRERARAASLVQVGGRVNRHGKRQGAVVWDFVTNDRLLNRHPDFEASALVVNELFQEDLWKGMDTTELMTEALRRELVQRSADSKIRKLRESESAGQYVDVASLTRLITGDTRMVVVDSRLRAELEEGKRRRGVRWRDLLAGSVQLWLRRIAGFDLPGIAGMEGVYAWEYEYDPEFLGIMAGALRLIEGDTAGYVLL